MFHGIHAITAQLSPIPNSSGIELLESDNLNIYCFQSVTGLKFIIITDTGFQTHEISCLKLYEIYSDFAMKNPFYQPDMPIRAELFDLNIMKFVKTLNT
ncbi:Sybindin-like protein [Globomyces pollinis-pini]|nr:Sybindin-like protein [Globomyces pollinis-pini]